jgi:5'-nucleotidase
MRILITNDDGIHAPGLAVLERIARELSDDVHVVAPETDQSGVSHSLSLNDPLRWREIGPNHHAVQGTPTDCVIMAVRHIMAGRRPDLILSGVNSGQNVAEDVTYSGTIAAAMEGTILGIRSIALSQAYPRGDRDSIPWDCAGAHGAQAIRKVLDIGFPRGSCVNINFPPCAPSEVSGMVAAVQGSRNQELLRVDERHDGRGKPYYWLAFARGRIDPPEGSDLHALASRQISVTPLKLDLTDLPTVTEFARVLGG